MIDPLASAGNQLYFRKKMFGNFIFRKIWIRNCFSENRFLGNWIGTIWYELPVILFPVSKHYESLSLMRFSTYGHAYMDHDIDSVHTSNTSVEWLWMHFIDLFVAFICDAIFFTQISVFLFWDIFFARPFFTICQVNPLEKKRIESFKICWNLFLLCIRRFGFLFI